MVEELQKEEVSNSSNEKSKRVEFVPDSNIYESENELLLTIDMPGVDEKSVDIALNEDILTITGKSGFEIPKDYKKLYSEFQIGDFRRDFKVTKPIDMENGIATMKNGQLKLTIPKIKPKAKKIQVKSE